MIENQEFLIEEYKSCDEKVGRLDSLMWQTASVVFPISLAGFAVFGLSDQHTSDRFFTLVAVAVGSATLLLVWYLLSRQWYGYQSVAFYRMREIESYLGLWHYRYASFIRNTPNKRIEIIQGIEDKHDKEKFEKLHNSIGNLPRIGLKRAMITITGLFLFGWIGLIVREFILTFM